MNALRTMRAVAIAMLAMGLTAVQGLAQTPDPERAEAVLERAVAAEVEAARTGATADKEMAARLHVQSANLRAYNDPAAVASLRTAAMYLSYSRPAQAAELLVLAAERAVTSSRRRTATSMRPQPLPKGRVIG